MTQAGPLPALSSPLITIRKRDPRPAGIAREPVLGGGRPPLAFFQPLRFCTLSPLPAPAPGKNSGPRLSSHPQLCLRAAGKDRRQFPILLGSRNSSPRPRGRETTTPGMPRAPPARPPPVSSMLLHPVHLKQKSLSAGRGWALLGATERRSWTGARCGSLRGASGRRGLETPGSEAGGVGAEIPQPPAPRHPRRGEEICFLGFASLSPHPHPGGWGEGSRVTGCLGRGA